ncbi:MAG: glycosyltransferase family 2 protein [Chloroflexi bacterium]|nr:glycosyltransferase family 2 protein [Chloroflexota bacterium]
MTDPRVSVIIPTHNRAAFLLEALASVFAQTITDYEIIVVDDGSADDTRQRLAPHIKSRRVRYEYQDKSGVSAARNRGIQLARASYVALLDSDDLFLPTKLEKQLALFEAHPDLGLVHSQFSKFNQQGQDLGLRDTIVYQGWIYPWMLAEWSVLLGTSSLMLKRDAVLEVGGFDERMTWAEDIDLYRRVGRRYPVGVVPEVLNRMRVHSGASTAAKIGAADGYRFALDKAFAEDPDLPAALRRRAYANMYTNLAQNLLGEGAPELMGMARQHARAALGYRPLNAGVWAAWIASWLPRSLRHWLAARLRAFRYPARAR